MKSFLEQGSYNSQISAFTHAGKKEKERIDWVSGVNWNAVDVKMVLTRFKGFSAFLTHLT